MQKTVSPVMLLRLSALSAALSLTACGGGGGGGGDDADSGVLRGVFVDSAVQGLNYRTETQSGTTDANGTFRYLPGEIVTFRIGELTLGSAFAQSQLTPLEIANSVSLDDSRVRNIVRLLQTLDDDGNPGNGIRLRDEAVDVNPNLNLDDSAAIDSALDQILPGLSLVDVDEALAHFETTLASLPSRDGGGDYSMVTVGYFPGSTASNCPTWTAADLTVAPATSGGTSYTGTLSTAAGGVETFDLIGTGSRASGSTDALNELRINVDSLAGEIRVGDSNSTDSCRAVIHLTTNDAVNQPPVAYRNSLITQGICQSAGLNYSLSWDMHAADKDGYLAKHPTFRYTIDGQQPVELSVGANASASQHYGNKIPKRTDPVGISNIPCTAGVSWDYIVEDNEGEIVTVSGSFESQFDPPTTGGGSFEFCAQNYPVDACTLLNGEGINTRLVSGSPSCTSLGFSGAEWEDFSDSASGLATGTCILSADGGSGLPDLGDGLTGGGSTGGSTGGGSTGGGSGGSTGGGTSGFTFCIDNYPADACTLIGQDGTGSSYISTGPSCTSLGFVDPYITDIGTTGGTCLWGSNF